MKMRITEDKDVFSVIHQPFGSKVLPPENNVIIHLDSHPDMLLIKGEDSWILPAAYSGHISTLVWVKPPWAKQIDDGTYLLTVGVSKTSGEIRVCSSLPFFISNCLYSSLDSLENRREVTLEIITYGHFILNNDNAESEDFDKLLKRIQSKFPGGHHCILDIDLDFFSTYNPFKKLYKEVDLYSFLMELYWYGVPKKMTPKEMEEAITTREAQLTDLKQLWEHVSKHGIDGEQPESYLWPELKSIAKSLVSKYSNINWELIHEAGCTWDDSDEGLIEHVTSKDNILRLMNKTLMGLVNSLPKGPTVLTITRSSEYCPPDEVDWIQEELIKVLSGKFSLDIKELNL